MSTFTMADIQSVNNFRLYLDNLRQTLDTSNPENGLKFLGQVFVVLSAFCLQELTKLLELLTRWLLLLERMVQKSYVIIKKGRE